MEIEEIIDRIYPISDTSKLLIKECVTEIKYPKGHILLHANKVEKNIYFIKSGIARAYAENVDHEITFWFGMEGDPIVSMRSYIQNEKGYEDVELLEDCQLFELNTNRLQNLFYNDIQIANWGRKLAEKELIKTEERLISRQVRTATERYKEILHDHPDLIQRAPLRHIASYLGITQVSLSRIRAEIR